MVEIRIYCCLVPDQEQQEEIVPLSRQEPKTPVSNKKIDIVETLTKFPVLNVASQNPGHCASCEQSSVTFDGLLLKPRNNSEAQGELQAKAVIGSMAMDIAVKFEMMASKNLRYTSDNDGKKQGNAG